MAVIRTVGSTAVHEGDKVRGSRFVATLAPATTEAAALAVVRAVRAAHPDASHHCWAYRLAGGRERSSDDGEPAGTAGAPILRHLGGADLVDVVAVVTRWFGGTKLGTGGLIRAYGGAVARALADVAVVERPVMADLAMTWDYELTGVVEGVLAAWSAAVVDADYGAAVIAHVSLPAEDAEAFAAAMAEATSGRVTPRPPAADPSAR